MRSPAQEMRPFPNLSNKRAQNDHKDGATTTQVIPPAPHGPRRQKKTHKYLEALH